MKIECVCGERIHDSTDSLPSKAHTVPDQEWFAVLDAIDEAIETAGPSPMEKEAACMAVRSLLGRVARLAWQCRHCRRLYIDDQRYQLHTFAPDGPDVPRELFRSRPSDA